MAWYWWAAIVLALVAIGSLIFQWYTGMIISVVLIALILTIRIMSIPGMEGAWCLGILIFITLVALIFNIHHAAAFLLFLAAIALILFGIAWLVIGMGQGNEGACIVGAIFLFGVGAAIAGFRI